MRYAPGLLVASPPASRAQAGPRAHRDADHALLRLQRTAGNAAVGRLIQLQRDKIGVQRDKKSDDAARGERFVTATTSGDWAGAVQVLLHADDHWMTERLGNLRTDELRYLDDAVRRAGAYNTLLRRMINANLMQRAHQMGAAFDSSLQGRGYGVLEGKATKVTDGKIVPGGTNQQASYRFEITFMPNPALVKAQSIEFIQLAQVVSTVNTTPDPTGVPVGQNAGANGPNRQTADHSRVDRLPHMNQGWIGEANNAQPIAGRLRPWVPGSSQPAWMEDTPSRTVPNIDFHFETAAVCRAGPDLGMVYATVVWGFTIDAAMKVVAKEPVYFNKESKDFDLAVTFWNTEAAQAGSTQVPLPANLH